MNQPPKIPVLAVRPEYAELLTCYKDIEVRHYSAPKKYIGQRIAIYASKRNPDKFNLERINSYLDSCPNFISGKIKGAIVATAILERCSKVRDILQYRALSDSHFAPDEYFIPGKTYFWVLNSIITLDDPLPFEFHGPVVWSSIEAEQLAGWLD
jgi:hypothetical protein